MNQYLAAYIEVVAAQNEYASRPYSQREPAMLAHHAYTVRTTLAALERELELGTEARLLRNTVIL